MTILIDTREKIPFFFQTPSIVGTVPTGDYSLVGFEDRVAIERKERNDLVACLKNGKPGEPQNRDRFERELERSRALEYFAVVVEAPWKDIAAGRYTSRMHPNAVVQSLLTFSVRYRLPLFFADNRQHARMITESLLLKFAREVETRPHAPADAP